MKLPLAEIALIVKGRAATLDLLEMAPTVVDALSQLPRVDESVSRPDLAIAIKFIVSEIALVAGAIFANIDSFSGFLSVFNCTFVAGSIVEVDFAVDKTVVPEESGLFVFLGDKFAPAVVFKVLHAPFVGIPVLLVEDGIGAVPILEGALESIATCVVNFTLAVLFALGVD